MNEAPVMLIMMIGLGVYLAKAWLDDRRDHIAGTARGQGLPGATPASTRACFWAGGGAVILLLVETGGEMALGLTAEQSKITVLFGLYTLAAAVIEEIVFRGYLVIEGRGARLRRLGTVAASLVFALVHPFLWTWGDDGFEWTFTAKGWFSTVMVFAASLWFYAVRFATWNPERSLLPCFVAHGVKNLGVFAIKGAQGFVVGWW
jgi:membrane protease YdiL (CAAX protease family)